MFIYNKNDSAVDIIVAGFGSVGSLYNPEPDYYKNITTGLIKSAINEIQNSFHIKTIHVPGVFEIPVIISKKINTF